MADINHQITLGIGTPGSIAQFLTLGLFIGEAADAPIVTIVMNTGVYAPRLYSRQGVYTPIVHEPGVADSDIVFPTGQINEVP